MLAFTLTCALQLGALPPPLPAATLAQAPAAATAPAVREERHKSFNPLIGVLELTVGLVAGYAGASPVRPPRRAAAPPTRSPTPNPA